MVLRDVKIYNVKIGLRRNLILNPVGKLQTHDEWALLRVQEDSNVNQLDNLLARDNGQNKK